MEPRSVLCDAESKTIGVHHMVMNFRKSRRMYYVLVTSDCFRLKSLKWTESRNGEPPWFAVCYEIGSSVGRNSRLVRLALITKAFRWSWYWYDSFERSEKFLKIDHAMSVTVTVFTLLIRTALLCNRS